MLVASTEVRSRRPFLAPRQGKSLHGGGSVLKGDLGGRPQQLARNLLPAMVRCDVEAGDQPDRIVVSSPCLQRWSLHRSVEPRSRSCSAPADWSLIPVRQEPDRDLKIVDGVDQQCSIPWAAGCVKILHRDHIPRTPAPVGGFIGGEEGVEIRHVPRVDRLNTESGTHRTRVTPSRPRRRGCTLCRPRRSSRSIRSGNRPSPSAPRDVDARQVPITGSAGSVATRDEQSIRNAAASCVS